jgi:4-carboxymuconolactone decarboxylase
MSESDYEEGMKVRREVLGDEYVNRAIEQTTQMTAPFQELITRYAWGAVWSRPGLDRRMRSAITVALLAALGREHELEAHLLAARRNGLSDDEIGEVLLHTGIYAGAPAANAAFAIARRTLGE